MIHILIRQRNRRRRQAEKNKNGKKYSGDERKMFRRSNHRLDSVIESSLREIRVAKNFALSNLSLNFCETTIYATVFLGNFVAVH